MRWSAFALLMPMALCGAGCSSTIAAQRPLSDETLAEVNQAIEGRVARAELVEKQPRAVEVKEARVGRDTTVWLEQSGKGEALPRSVPTAALQRITVKQGDVGALEGLGIGFLAGAAAGFVVGAIFGATVSPNLFGGCPSVGCSLVFGGYAALVAGPPTAILFGLPIGGLTGHRTIIDFGAPESRANEKPGPATSAPGAVGSATPHYALADGHWFFGAGLSALGGAQGAGPGLSIETDYQMLQWGLRAEALWARNTTNTTNPIVTGVSVLGTGVFGSSPTGPYLGAGLGYLRQTGGSTDVGTSAPGDGVAAMAEAGILFFRDRSWGRAVWSLRLTVPLFAGSPPMPLCKTPPNCGPGPYYGGGTTAFVFGSVSLRILL
jgi:hypothetical protein